jgi:hypothetical protein
MNSPRQRIPFRKPLALKYYRFSNITIVKNYVHFDFQYLINIIRYKMY